MPCSNRGLVLAPREEGAVDYGATTMTVTGVGMNRDGIAVALQQFQIA